MQPSDAPAPRPAGHGTTPAPPPAERPSGTAHTDPDLDGTVLQQEAEAARAKALSQERPAEPGPPTETQSGPQAARARWLSRGKPAAAGYEVLEPLGEGAFGEVWLARACRTGVRVAIKFFRRQMDRQSALLAEVKQLAEVYADPGIVQLLDVELGASPPYYVMAYAEGGSLAARLKRGPLPVAEAMEVFRQVTEALAYVHVKGIRHCDLKPANVLLDARGRPRLADFGQAHLASDQAPALGTFFYMAPEQADVREQAPDPRWDVYALGVMLHEMLTGHPPGAGAALREELRAIPDLGRRLARYREHAGTAARRAGHRGVPGVDGPLADLIDRCLEADPQRRLSDAAAVLAAMSRRQEALAEQARRELKRRQRPLLAFGLFAPLLLLAGMAASLDVLIRASVQDSERSLVEQAERHNQVTAALIANVLKDEFEAQAGLLRGPARDPELRRLLRQAPVPHEQLCERLKAFRPAEGVERWFPRMALADDKGHIVAEDPPKPELRAKQWSWREWYNGERHYFGREADLFPPTDRVGVSGPYLNKESGKPVVTLVHPVREPGAGGRVIGLLRGTIPVERLSASLNEVKLRQAHSSLVLLNRHGHVLLHTRAGPPEVPADRDPDVARGPLFERLAAGQAASLTDHGDPFTGRRKVAAAAPVPAVASQGWGTGWGVVAQSDREEVLGPVRGLRAWLRRVGLLALVAVGLLTSALWAGLIWRLRRMERVSHG